MRIAFCHPDLGLGGAERLVVDAALEIQAHGHQVEIFTAHYDPERCFAETRNGQIPPIRVHGDWLPRHLFGKGHALFASLRCLIVALAICRSHLSFDAAFVDQVSTVLPVFRFLRPSMKTLFYCHFPDLLLSKKGGWLKRLYRWPLDALEQWTTGQADLVVVNSAFTADVFAQTFARLHRRGIRPAILHPAVQIPSREQLADAACSWRDELPLELVQFLEKPEAVTFLSINRFERKKKIELAIHSLHDLLLSRPTKRIPQLILAGGYDARVMENVEHLGELKALTRELKLEAFVYFFLSFTDRQKSLLLSACTAVVYTPPNEHFGIVPLESMAFGCPVIACHSGGPIESIVHGQTGFLAPPKADAFAKHMEQMCQMDLTEMDEAGRTHVRKNFSRSIFGRRLVGMLTTIVQKKQQ